MDFIELAKLNFEDFNRDLKKLVDECKQSVISVPRSNILALSLMQRIRDSLNIIEKTYNNRFVVSITLCREDDTNILIRMHDMLKQFDASESSFEVFEPLAFVDNEEDEQSDESHNSQQTKIRHSRHTARFEKQKTCSDDEFLRIREFIQRNYDSSKIVKISLALAASDISASGNMHLFLASLNIFKKNKVLSSTSTINIRKFMTNGFGMHPDIDEDFKRKIRNYLGEDYIKDIVTKYNAFITTKVKGKVA